MLTLDMFDATISVMEPILKDWITRPEIEKMFWITTQTFNKWAASGKFGEPTGSVPSKSGKGRPLFTYSMARVMAVYELEYLGVAARAVAQGEDPAAFPEYTALMEGDPVLPKSDIQPVILWVWSPRTAADGYNLVRLPEFDSDAAVYDGLPVELDLDKTVKSVIPDKPDLWDDSVSLLCPPFAGISIALCT